MDIDQYDVENGLLGMLRDVIIRLCVFMGEKSHCIKAVMGICEHQVKWKSHYYFQSIRKNYLAHSFRPNPFGGCLLTLTIDGWRCYFQEYSLSYEPERTIFLNKPINEGIISWSVKINYGDNTNFSSLQIGVALTGPIGSAKMDSDCRRLGNNNLNNEFSSCCFSFWRYGTYKSGLVGAAGTARIPDGETPVEDGSVVTAEMDSERKTLSFFVNKKKIPRVITTLSAPVHFGMSGSPNSSFVSLSLCRLASPTLSSAVDIAYHNFKRTRQYC